jgi:hypothetical protein
MEPERGMQMACLKLRLQWFSAAAAFASPCLWLYSARASVKAEDYRDESGLFANVDKDLETGEDIQKTMKKQSKWNGYAAFVASFAAAAQGLSMVLTG